MKYYETETGVVHSDFKAGYEYPYLTSNVSVKSESDLAKGSVLSAESDGTLSLTTTGKEAKYILAQEMTGSSDVQIGVAYQSGIFDRKTLTCGDELANHEEELRKLGIYLTEEM